MKRTLKERLVRVCLSEHEYQKLNAYAEKHEVTVSHVIREYLRRLPNYHHNNASVQLSSGIPHPMNRATPAGRKLKFSRAS